MKGIGRNCSTVEMIEPMSMAPLAVVGSTIFPVVVDDGANGTEPPFWPDPEAADVSRLLFWLLPLLKQTVS